MGEKTGPETQGGGQDLASQAPVRLARAACCLSSSNDLCSRNMTVETVNEQSGSA